MDKTGVVAACSQRQLTNGFKERQRFNITDRAADFNQCDIGIAGSMSTAGDEILNFIGDVRNDLNGLTLIFTAAFFAQNITIDLAGRKVIRLVHLRRDEALIVT